jgi:GH3 auxin-responsive promoter
MVTLVEMVRQERYDEIWRQYCGFLDLSLAEFMKVQERLLLEQLDLVGRSEWGRLFFQGQVPATVEEYRRVAPLTSYEDYEPHFSEKREDMLPKKPSVWSHTSGRSGKYKWVPYTQKMYAAAGEHSIAALILSMARRRGEVRLEEGDVLVYNMPSPPYSSGISVMSMAEAFPFQFVPPLELNQRISFQQRMEMSFQMALVTGIDIIGSMSAVLVKIGERFAAGAGAAKPSRQLLKPRALWRIIRALLRSRMAHRPMLPKDLWSPKGVVCGGTDTALYKDVVTQYWGATPYELYATTETGGTTALQAWNKDGLYFLPDVAFFEFIAEAEWTRNREDATYVPKTVLLDEVEPGQRYELVLTSFHGGPFLRYRICDLIRFVAQRDAEAGIALPSMVCAGRSDGLIDLAGFSGPIDEPMLWRAIHETGIAYEEWTVRKEIGPKGALLHLFLELRESVPAEEVRRRVHENLKTANPFYADLEAMLETGPIEVTLLQSGTFGAYYLEQQAAGADLAHMKPPHMNPSEQIIQDLQRLGAQVT